jgi:hypothetical protein
MSGFVQRWKDWHGSFRDLVAAAGTATREQFGDAVSEPTDSIMRHYQNLGALGRGTRDESNRHVFGFRELAETVAVKALLADGWKLPKIAEQMPAWTEAELVEVVTRVSAALARPDSASFPEEELSTFVAPDSSDDVLTFVTTPPQEHINALPTQLESLIASMRGDASLDRSADVHVGQAFAQPASAFSAGPTRSAVSLAVQGASSPPSGLADRSPASWRTGGSREPAMAYGVSNRRVSPGAAAKLKTAASVIPSGYGATSKAEFSPAPWMRVVVDQAAFLSASDDDVEAAVKRLAGDLLAARSRRK